jgi:2-aminoethylphosphonate-pyruvate transaminase
MTNDPYLLTPGPLTTSMATKKAMLHDWGSRDENFIEATAKLRQRLLAIANAQDSHVCVPLQGSGTFVVEATIGTLIPKDAKALILINGAYGRRMADILKTMGRAYLTLETPEDVPSDTNALDSALKSDPAITHVLAVHCETTSGILNPISEIAAITANHGRRLIIDAMSSFGAVPLDAKEVPFEALAASSNKCLEGVPGMGFSIIRRDALEACDKNAHSLSLDLCAQWKAMEQNGQWRFTPPTHVLAALNAALDDFDANGGLAGRNERYAENCRILVDGMRAIGFKTFLSDALQAPIIVTFHTPDDPAFQFDAFYNSLRKKGYVIYPGKLTKARTFRIGCIGSLGPEQMKGALEAVRETISQMGFNPNNT